MHEMPNDKLTKECKPSKILTYFSNAICICNCSIDFIRHSQSKLKTTVPVKTGDQCKKLRFVSRYIKYRSQKFRYHSRESNVISRPLPSGDKTIEEPNLWEPQELVPN